LLHLMIIIVLPFLMFADQTEQRSPVALITVTGGDHEFHDHVVSVELPEWILPGRPLQLVELKEGNSERVPLQVEQSWRREGTRLWFIVQGVLPAHYARRYELYYGEPVHREGIHMSVDKDRVRFKHDDKLILQYNHGHVPPPEGADQLFIRSGYIHPVYSPMGFLVTEDFPEDHLHHKGVWFPWTRTRFEGREIDFWNLGSGEGTVQFAGFESFQSGPIFSGFQARHQFVDLTQPDGGKVALNEVWDIRAWNNNDTYFLWDLTSTQRCATDSPLELVEYHYGGLGFRGAKQWTDENHVILTSEGHTKKDGHTKRSRWVAHSGEIEDGKWATVVIMVHPDNERFPEPMRIWDTGGSFFCYSPVQLGDWTLLPGNDYLFKYRFMVYDGEIDAERAENMWLQFSDPAETRIEGK
jgi:hypothetical protein